MPPEKPRTSSKPQLPKVRLVFRSAILKRKHPDWPDRPVRILIAFTETDEACPFVILNGDNAIGKVASRVSALYLAKLEALKCSTIIQFLKDLVATPDDPDKGNLINRAFFDSAVVWYSKLYIESDDGRVKLDSLKVYQNHPDHLKVHNRIIEMRHKSIAHQTGRFEGVIPYVALNPDETNKDIIEFYYNFIHPNFHDEHFINSFLDMAQMTADKIDRMILSAEGRLLKDLESKGMDALYSLALKIDSSGNKEDGSYLKLDETIIMDNFATYIRHHK